MKGDHEKAYTHIAYRNSSTMSGLLFVRDLYCVACIAVENLCAFGPRTTKKCAFVSKRTIAALRTIFMRSMKRVHF